MSSNDSTSSVKGTWSPGADAIVEAFAGNLAGADLGASAAVTVGGELVVDVWGGHSDLARRDPWRADTIVNVWSSTKMLTALVILTLHERGLLSVDEPVALYWPEFAANGKDRVLVRHVMGHTAGLCVFDELPDATEVFDWDECCRRLAAQAPRWEPGDGSGYHAETQGFLLGELVRRTDGRTIGEFLAEEVTRPEGIDAHVGLADTEHHRVADLLTTGAEREVVPGSEIHEIGARAGNRSLAIANTRAWRRAELPASNGHMNARALAQALAPLANGGRTIRGRQLLSGDTIERAFEVQADGIDRVMGREMRLGLGFGLNSPGTPLGVNDRTLWWAGWGGSWGIVDVERQATIAYTPNRMLGEDDMRGIRVIFAAHAFIDDLLGA